MIVLKSERPWRATGSEGDVQTLTQHKQTAVLSQLAGGCSCVEAFVGLDAKMFDQSHLVTNLL